MDVCCQSYQTKRTPDPETNADRRSHLCLEGISILSDLPLRGEPLLNFPSCYGYRMMQVDIGFLWSTSYQWRRNQQKPFGSRSPAGSGTNLKGGKLGRWFSRRDQTSSPDRWRSLNSPFKGGHLILNHPKEGHKLAELPGIRIHGMKTSVSCRAYRVKNGQIQKPWSLFLGQNKSPNPQILTPLHNWWAFSIPVQIKSICYSWDRLRRRNELLVGGFNPSEKHESNWIISPNRDENKNIWNHQTD